MTHDPVEAPPVEDDQGEDDSGLPPFRMFKIRRVALPEVLGRSNEVLSILSERQANCVSDCIVLGDRQRVALHPARIVERLKVVPVLAFQLGGDSKLPRKICRVSHSTFLLCPCQG